MSENEFRNTVHIEFPKPLPDLVIADIPDETGFTGSEKVALRNAMRVIMPRFQMHAVEIFLDFFTKNDTFIESFRRGHKYNTRSLSQHASQVVYVYDRIINVGLNSKAALHVVLMEVFRVHKECNVPPKNIQMLSNAITDYLLKVLESNSSPTLASGLKRLSDSIQAYFVEKPTIKPRHEIGI